MTTEQQELVLANLRLVEWAVKRWYGTYRGEWRQELIDAAEYGLLKAAAKFKPEKGIKFSTYATRCIFNACLGQQEKIQRRTQREGERAASEAESTDWGEKVAVDETAADTRYRARKLFMTASLSPKEVLVLRRRFWDGKKLQAVSEELGLSRERVRQVEGSAIEKLKKKAGVKCL